MTGSSGAVTGRIERLVVTVEARTGNIIRETLFRKTLRPLAAGRHAVAARSPSHWAYWRRELLAYASGLLPTGPGLEAPALVGIKGDSLYLREVVGPAARADVAAAHLGEWQASTRIPDHTWLARHQLAQRVATTVLDWRAVDADPQWERNWRRRGELLARIDRAPTTVVHGDFSAGNLLAPDPARTVALDWAAFGVGPVGADLVSLTLSTLTDQLEPYLDGLAGRFPRGDVESAYVAALQLTAASRVHWMLERGMSPPWELAELVLGR